MLLLTRKVGEAIIINDDIKIIVTDVIGGQVRIGISAPDEVIINREEIHERMQEHLALSYG